MATKTTDTSFADMVQEGPLDFRVRTSVYTDPEIFQEEMHRIFEKTWVYVCHESQIEKLGDYRTAMVGRNSVIVTRDKDNQINVLLNECIHRGNAVCRYDRGNAMNLRCPYHGWTYTNSGELIGVTHNYGYPEGFAEGHGLIHLKTATYRGLIFASISDDVPTIEEHLGETRKYVDLWADLSPEPEVRLLTPHKYGYNGNWKFQVENGHDGWHARFVHESAFRTMEHFGGPPRERSAVVGHTRGFDRGHGILERAAPRQGMSDEQVAWYQEELTRRHGAERADLIYRVRHIMIFPNVYLFDNLIRTIQPISVGRTEVYSSVLSWRGVSDEINKVRLAEVQARLSTTGLISPDDLEMFASNQTGMHGAKMDWVVLSHGMAQEEKVGSGSERVGEDTSEVPQRAVYRAWAKYMSANGAPAH